ncbi:hypothetical protein IC617_18425 [Neiella sp. HB171785]|uniref:Uncharacterized protein n=1 Tax=Neiella litorisoli TaxID=2771431 RepID=A0A8J6QWE9_9GAMM|nr:hypothetical protein [Neiella litorisoli]MBD1391408.1 hypothetical protein [Neiella litorisoli]
MSKREMDALLDQMMHQMDRITTQWQQSEHSFDTPAEQCQEPLATRPLTAAEFEVL